MLAALFHVQCGPLELYVTHSAPTSPAINLLCLSPGCRPGTGTLTLNEAPCQPCPNGTYSPGGSLTPCIRCPGSAFMVTPPKATRVSQCTCRPGKQITYCCMICGAVLGTSVVVAALQQAHTSTGGLSGRKHPSDSQCMCNACRVSWALHAAFICRPGRAMTKTGNNTCYC